MTTLIGLSGSLRAGSLNSALLRAAVELAPDGVVIEIASIRDVPLYDGDLEAAQGIPPSVRALKDRVAAADGLLIASPEYNQGIPGVLKNAIDWMSRPATDIARVFGGKPVALIGATPGRGATSLAQAAWLPVLRALGTRAWFGGQLGVAGAGPMVDASGRFTDEPTRARLAVFVAGFAQAARAR
ncbi:MAG: NAD(P)H-dependent oxidoreductase [Sandaracinaceae bacterium]|nr:NAD(P)H-dependent oxidoreductase [Sandaracinaceae bacterium]